MLRELTRYKRAMGTPLSRFHRIFLIFLILSPLHWYPVISEDMVDIDDDEVTVENENGDEDSWATQNVFQPTSEWQTIEKGQMIPPGLHVRMNLQTGLREAKLMDQNEVPEQNISDGKEHREQYKHTTAEETMEQRIGGTQEEDGSTSEEATKDRSTGTTPSPGTATPTDAGTIPLTDSERTFKPSGDHRRAHYYGESDRRGIINKKTKAFTKQQFAEMLMQLNNNSADLQNLPGIAYGGPTRERHTHEVDEGGENSRKGSKITLHEPNDATFVLHRDNAVVLELTRILVNESAPLPELLHALEELEYYVHQIDNAKDLNLMGGLVPVIRLLNHTHPDVRSHAAHVIGSATQSNPMVQADTLEYGALHLLCKLIADSEPEIVQRRALFALSALLRGNPLPQWEFTVKCQGFQVLGSSFQERSLQMQLKGVTLLTDLLDEQRELPSDQQEALPVLLLDVRNYGWCNHVATLIHTDNPSRIEKGLLAMETLAPACDFTPHGSRLQQLVQRYREMVDQDKEENEFILSLLERSRNLLSTIRQRNRSLEL